MEPEIRVRGYHTDLYQHVNNARYLEFLEEGRWQLFDDHWDLEAFMKKGFLFFVVNLNISYKSQAKVNDLIVVKSGLEKIGNKSAVIKQEIFNKTTGQLCIDADVTFVIADMSGKPVKIEGEIREKIETIPLFEV